MSDETKTGEQALTEGREALTLSEIIEITQSMPELIPIIDPAQVLNFEQELEAIEYVTRAAVEAGAIINTNGSKVTEEQTELLIKGCITLANEVAAGTLRSINELTAHVLDEEIKKNKQGTSIGRIG